jgi:hypothetical protein
VKSFSHDGTSIPAELTKILIKKDLASYERGTPIAIHYRSLRESKYVSGGAFVEKPEVIRIVDERRAAVVLGLSLPELRWFSRCLDLGQSRQTGEDAERVFTYEELRKLSMAAFTSAK